MAAPPARGTARAGELSLARLRWTDLAAGEPPLVLVPVGSLEQHGPALGLATDAVVAVQVAGLAATRLHEAADGAEPDVVVAPVVAYGASGEHEGFPGTISIGHEALALLLVELGRSACGWARGVVFVNGHGGNVATLVEAVAQLREEGRAVAWTACRADGADAHAGLTETSLMMRVAPRLVHAGDLEVGRTEPVAELMPLLRQGGVRAVSPNGVLGDPRGADARHGDRVLEEMVGRLVEELRLLDVGPGGRLTVPAPSGAAS